MEVKIEAVLPLEAKEDQPRGQARKHITQFDIQNGGLTKQEPN